MQAAVQLMLTEGLSFLGELGPARLVALVTGVPIERLAALAGALPRPKILRLLKEAPIERVTVLISNMKNEDIIYLIKNLPEDEIVYLIQHLPREDLLAWLADVSIQDTAGILKSLGAKDAVQLLRSTGIQKAAAALKILKPRKIKELIDGIGLKATGELTGGLPESDLRLWLKSRGVEDLKILVPTLGAGNLLKLFEFLTVQEAIHIVKEIGPRRTVLLMRESKRMSFPRLGREERELLEDTGDRAKSKSSARSPRKQASAKSGAKSSRQTAKKAAKKKSGGRGSKKKKAKSQAASVRT